MQKNIQAYGIFVTEVIMGKGKTKFDFVMW